MQEKKPLYQFLTGKQKQRHLKMEQLAQRCGVSRTTLYRFMCGQNPMNGVMQKKLAQALELTREEEGELTAVLSLDQRAVRYSAAYPLLDRILFGLPGEAAAELKMPFAFFSMGEKYLRDFEEIIGTIETIAETRQAAAAVRIVGCTDESCVAYLIKLMEGLFSATASVRAEHFLISPADDPVRSARTLADMLPLLQYDGYQIFYTELALEKHTQSLFSDSILIDLSDQQEGEVRHEYFSLSFCPDGLSQCIQHQDRDFYAYFENAYLNLRKQYQNGLMVYKNLSVMSQQVADFETGGEICLLKTDLCYNFFPPEVYVSLFARMKEYDKQAFFSRVFGKSVGRSGVEGFEQRFCSTLAQRNAVSKTYPSHFVCSREGLLYFAQTGRLMDALLTGTPPFTRAERRKIFEEFLRRMNDPEDPAHILITDERLLASGNMMDVNREQGLLIDFGGKLQYGMCRNLLIQNQSLCDLFFDYVEHFFETNHAVSAEQARQFLSEIVDKLSR